MSPHRLQPGRSVRFPVVLFTRSAVVRWSSVSPQQPRSDIFWALSSTACLIYLFDVQELLENSLDAGASVVELRLRAQGTESLELIDNGHGVQEQNFAGNQ